MKKRNLKQVLGAYLISGGPCSRSPPPLYNLPTCTLYNLLTCIPIASSV